MEGAGITSAGITSAGITSAGITSAGITSAGVAGAEDVSGANVSGAANAVDLSLDYTYASAEYGGLVFYSYFKRAGNAAAGPAAKFLLPVWDKTSGVTSGLYKSASGVTSGAYKTASGATVKGFHGASGWVSSAYSKVRGYVRVDGARLSAVEEKLRLLEEKVAYLERHGVLATQEGGLQVRGKKLDESKMMFLRTVVQENIDLLKE